jgi:hypothetical protein
MLLVRLTLSAFWIATTYYGLERPARTPTPVVVSLPTSCLLDQYTS